MSVLVGGVVIALALAVGAIWAGLALLRRPAPSPSQAAHAARRHAAIVHGAAFTCLVGVLIAGNAIIAGLGATPRQGVYLGIVPGLAGLAFAAAHAVGEITWPRPTGTLRRATLTRRTPADVAPTLLRRATWTWAAVAAGTLVLCGLAADADGRGLTHTFAQGSAGAGPFPGWFYGVPLLAAIAAVVLAAESVLRLVILRPAVMDTAPEWDVALRRLSAHRVLRGAQLVLGLTATGVLVFGGSAVGRVAELTFSINSVTTTDSDLRYAILGTAMVALGLAIALTAAVLALIPGATASVRAPSVARSAAPDRGVPSA